MPRRALVAVIAITFAALAFAAGQWWQDKPLRPDVMIPAEWGEMRAATAVQDGNISFQTLWFVDKDGTIRQVTLYGGKAGLVQVIHRGTMAP